MTVRAPAPPPIDELVGLMATLSPGALERLRQEHPDEAAQQLLKIGAILGATTNIELRGKAALEALGPVTGHCDLVIARLKKRISGAAKVRTAAQVAAAIFGLEVLGAIAMKWPDDAAFVGAAVCVASNLTAILVEYLMKIELTGRDAGDLLRELVEARVEAELLTKELELTREDGWRSRRLPSLVGRANTLAANLRKILLLVS